MNMHMKKMHMHIYNITKINPLNVLMTLTGDYDILITYWLLKLK